VAEEKSPPAYHSTVAVWIVLLLLAAVSVGVALAEQGFLSRILPLAIAVVQAGLVIFFFMRMRMEKPLFKIFFFIALLILAVFIGFTFTDVYFRY
jgi:cytochrome c oxidase subunit 4